MATQSITAAPVSPVNSSIQSLKDALDRFEAVLNPEEKAQFTSVTTVPDASAALQLTTEIDNIASKTQRGRCMGVRMIQFLESVQQFTSIVNVLTSSHPAIAALVWAGVRTAFLIVGNFSHVLDELSKQLMLLSDVFPRYTQFGALYPGSIGLQTALCDYHVEVIRMCTNVVEYSRRSGVSQITFAVVKPFKSQFEPFVTRLRHLGKVIKLEIHHASQQMNANERKLQAVEREQASWFRIRAVQTHKGLEQSMQEIRRDMELRQLEERRIKLLNLLSRLDPSKAYRKTRERCLLGTCGWVLHSETFQQWRDDPKASSLWIPGKFGAGKTVLASSIIAHLNTFPRPETSVSHFFCRYNFVDTLGAEDIFGSITRQLLDDPSISLEQYISDWAHNERPTSSQMVQTLADALDKSRKYYVVIDGLDECSLWEQERSLATLQSLITLGSPIFKVALLARPEVARHFKALFDVRYTISMGAAQVEKDINRFVDVTLEDRLRRGRLCLGDQALFQEIQRAIKDGAQGMFLWAMLIIEEVCCQACDADIRESLRHLPRDLPELLGRILVKVSKNNAHNLQLPVWLFSWVGAALRPLTTAELREAMSIRPHQRSVDRSQYVNDIHAIVSSCGSFVMVDEEDTTVSFAHQSIKKFIFQQSTFPKPEAFQLTLFNANLHVEIISLTYLSLDEFKRQLSKSRLPAFQLSGNVVLKAIDSLHGAEIGFLGQQARRLRGGKAKDVDLANTVRWTTSPSRAVADEHTADYPLLGYLKEYWLLHTDAIYQSKEPWALEMLTDLLSSDSRIVGTPWRKGEWLNGSMTILQWIASNRSLSVFSILNKILNFPLSEQNARSNTHFPKLLHWYHLLDGELQEEIDKVEGVKVENCQRLLVADAQAGYMKTFKEWPKQYSIEKIWATLPKILKDTRSEVTYLALPEEIEGMLSPEERLPTTRKQPFLNISPENKELASLINDECIRLQQTEWTPLEAAAYFERQEVVDRLKSINLGCKIQCWEGKSTPLHIICSVSAANADAQVEIIEELEQLPVSRAYLDCVDVRGVTALMLAVGQRFLCSRLADLGASVFRRLRSGWNALHIAAMPAKPTHEAYDDAAELLERLVDLAHVPYMHTRIVPPTSQHESADLYRIVTKGPFMSADTVVQQLSWEKAERDLARLISNYKMLSRKRSSSEIRSDTRLRMPVRRLAGRHLSIASCIVDTHITSQDVWDDFFRVWSQDVSEY